MTEVDRELQTMVIGQGNRRRSSTAKSETGQKWNKRIGFMGEQ
jgi:hypothetical protein